MTVPNADAIVKRPDPSSAGLSPEFLAALRVAEMVYVAAACTSPSISVRAPAMSAWSDSGDGVHTAAEYKRLHGCGVNATSRLRSLYLGLPTGEEAFIDFDRLSVTERQAVIRDVFARPAVCAESAPLMGFAVGLVPDLAPALVLDLSIVVRTLYPSLPYQLSKRAAAGDLRAQAELARRDHHPCSLSAVVAALGLPEAYKAAHWPDGRGWTLSTLCGGHEMALAARALYLLEALEALTGTSTPSGDLAALRAMDTGGEFFDVFAKVPIELARIHVRGMRVDPERIDEIEQTASDQLSGLVADVLAAVPQLEVLRDDFEAVGKRGSAAVRQALGGYAASCGHPLPCDTQGLPKIGADHLVQSGAAGLPGLQAWQALEAAKRSMASAAALRIHSRPVGAKRRIHPTLSVKAVTGRLGCSEPNAQGMDAIAKGAIVAKDGCVLIEADFGAIEIRIAAAQAVQVLSEARDVIAGRRDAPEDVRQSLIRGSDEVHVPWPGAGDTLGLLAYWYSKVLALGTPLVDLLAAGLCPHDYTALGILQRAGCIELPEGIHRAAFMHATPRTELRALVGARRPAAKVANFGLLYLMSARGLWRKGVLDGVTWTESEAARVHNTWYDDFPEIRFAQLFTLATCADAEPVSMTVEKRYGGHGLETKPHRLHRSKTLGGREIVCHDDRVINARAQGTGATMCLKSIVDAPAYLKDTILMPVHDSILCEVPAGRAEWFAAELARCMRAAAAVYLEPWGVPVVVETKVGKTWGTIA